MIFYGYIDKTGNKSLISGLKQLYERGNYLILKNFERAIDRSSHREAFCKKGILKNFAKFTGKHLCQGLFFSKVAGLRAVTLLKKRL